MSFNGIIVQWIHRSQLLRAYFFDIYLYFFVQIYRATLSHNNINLLLSHAHNTIIESERKSRQAIEVYIFSHILYTRHLVIAYLIRQCVGNSGRRISYYILYSKKQTLKENKIKGINCELSIESRGKLSCCVHKNHKLSLAVA